MNLLVKWSLLIDVKERRGGSGRTSPLSVPGKTIPVPLRDPWSIIKEIGEIRLSPLPSFCLQLMAPLQIIGAGFGRTGTHSLCLALDKLG